MLFSDGVTEAMNAEGEEFTDDRLIACANAHLGETPQQVLDALLADVHAFCAGEPQSDDVTAVLVRYNGQLERTRPLSRNLASDRLARPCSSACAVCRRPRS